MNLERIYNYNFSEIYDLYVSKIKRKEKSPDDLNAIIYWLTGYDERQLNGLLHKKMTLKEFFDASPNFNDKSSLVTGVICGVRIETIEDETYKKIRVLDKLVDELAKGKAMNKIMREGN